MRLSVKRRLVIFFVLFLIASCGAGDDYPSDVPTDSPPIVSRIDPNAGAPGDAITIFGLGFSIAAPNNTVIIGGAAVAATSYRLVDPPTSTEIEALTATVPTGAATGTSSVVVVVYDQTSNADVAFTVTP